MKKFLKGLLVLVTVLVVVIMTFTVTIKNVKIMDVDSGVVLVEVFGHVFEYEYQVEY